MKKFFNAMFVFIMIFAMCINLQAATGSIKILVDEKYLEMDVAPVIVDGRTLVPVRAVVEKLGGKVDWNEEKSLVTVTQGDTTILLTLNDTTAIVNGIPVELDVPAQSVDSRTMIPLRFVAEALGVKVDFYENTVIILTDRNSDSSTSKFIVDGISEKGNENTSNFSTKSNTDTNTTNASNKNGTIITDGAFTVTSPISRGETATLTFQGEGNTDYTIEVYYSTTKSTASGLEKKKSDANGNVSWSWKIGSKTNPGTFRIVVKGGSSSYETKIIVQ